MSESKIKENSSERLSAVRRCVPAQRVSKIALQVLKEQSREHGLQFSTVAYGDIDTLHEIYERQGRKIKNEHPLNIHQYILNCIDAESREEDAIFDKTYFQSLRGNARCFVVKQEHLA